MQIRGFKLLAGIVALMFVAGGVARAGTKNFKGSSSGTVRAVPGDFDADSCFTASNGAIVCTDASTVTNVGGMISPGARFTEQDLEEFDAVPGTGCILPGVASCTLAGSSETGCEFQLVGSGAGVIRDNASGDLLFIAYSADTYCFDLSSGPPFNFTGSANANITGGTGKNAGATGVETSTYHGQQLNIDPAGHGQGWVEEKLTGTITTP